MYQQGDEVLEDPEVDSCTLMQRMVCSTSFFTTTSPLLEFYLHLCSMSTFSLIKLALCELFSFYLKTHI
jgi:hypothetical protein